ncbi:MAG TPA: FHA domain-containing protein [Enhygromyxa sp.]|nr:FHA domain-containing protein [Enhygromyxa sp.]
MVSHGQPAMLTVLTGACRGTRFELGIGEQIIGRGERADIRIDDTGVSREHAKLVWTLQGVVNLIDLRSTNGTAINGHRIDAAVLRPGDRIQIGPEVELWFGHQPPTIAGEQREDAAKRLRKLLSARQLQVARLVAEGLSNKDIAERLGIRVRTVESHLDHVYRELGISSRSALTRVIVEAGLSPREGR